MSKQRQIVVLLSILLIVMVSISVTGVAERTRRSKEEILSDYCSILNTSAYNTLRRHAEILRNTAEDLLRGAITPSGVDTSWADITKATITSFGILRESQWQWEKTHMVNWTKQGEGPPLNEAVCTWARKLRAGNYSEAHRYAQYDVLNQIREARHATSGNEYLENMLDQLQKLTREKVSGSGGNGPSSIYVRVTRMKISENTDCLGIACTGTPDPEFIIKVNGNKEKASTWSDPEMNTWHSLNISERFGPNSYFQIYIEMQDSDAGNPAGGWEKLASARLSYNPSEGTVKNTVYGSKGSFTYRIETG